MKRVLPVVAAFVLIVVTALVQGHWSERWNKFPELTLFAEQLNNVPQNIGTWQGETKEEPTQKILDAAGAVGSLSREYHNTHGDTVSVFIVCGRVQDMFYHEPKRCYRAAGFEMQEEPRHHSITLKNGDTADFSSSRFVKDDSDGKVDQQVYWSWCGSGKWEAPDEPKWTFGGQRALYKLYVIYTPSRNDSPDENPATAFIPELLPALNLAFQKALDASPKMQPSQQEAAETTPAVEEPSSLPEEDDLLKNDSPSK